MWLCRLHLYTIFYAPYMYITFICYYPLPLCLASILSKLLIRRRTLCERRALYFCIFSPLVFYGNVPVCERRRHNIQSTVERRSCRSAPVVYLRIVHVLLHSVQKSFLYFNFLSTLWPNDTARNLRTFCKTILNNSFGVGGDDFVIIC